MSIINDALKKAQDKKSTQIFSNVGQLKRDSERFMLRIWLVWTGTGIMCLAGIVWAVMAFRQPQSPNPVQEDNAISELSMRNVDIEKPLKATDFRLSGILYDKQKPMAIINGRILKEGSSIGGAKLLEIQPDYVRISLKGEELRLQVK